MNVLDQADKLASDAKTLSEGAVELKSAITEFGTEQYNKGWDEAMAQAGSGGSTDKIYSEAEMNAIIEETKAPLQEKIDGLQGKVDAFPEQLDSAKVEAKTELKSELKAAYESEQSTETTSESAFGDLLK